MIPTFVIFILSIAACVVGYPLVSYLRSQRMPRHIVPDSLRGRVPTKALDKMTIAFSKEVANTKRYGEWSVRNAISKITCEWVPLREGKWPALEDQNFLLRLENLGLPPPTSERLEQKALVGEYDRRTQKFYAEGMAIAPATIKVTWHEDPWATAYTYELANAVLGQLAGWEIARKEGSPERAWIDKIVAELRGKV